MSGNPDTDDVRSLIETIAAELERPRDVTNQVAKHLDGTYGIEHDNIGRFLEDRMPLLEDDEHDLILSPLFTPKLADQAIIADVMGSTVLAKQDWPALIEDLANRPTVAHLVTSDRQPHPVRLRAVSIERFVNRLRLDGSISGSVSRLIDKAPAADQPMLKAVARRAIWESNPRAAMLERLLSKSLASGSFSLKDCVDLLRLAEDYQPADASAMLERIPKWQKLLEDEIDSGGTAKPYFSQAVQQLHGGNNQRQADEARTESKRAELAFLNRLQKLLSEN